MSALSTTPVTPAGPTEPAGPAAGPVAGSADSTRPSAQAGTRPREHRYDIDLLRVLASVGVIVCHSAAELMNAVHRTPGEGRAVYWTALVADGLSRCAVPLFFAMAGWVVLSGAPPRDSRQIRTRLTRIVVPFAVWTVLYLLWERVRGVNADPTRKVAFEALFGSVQPAFHLWYLYSYVPVILLLSVVVLIRAGKRPWGPAAVLLALTLVPALLGDARTVFGLDLPRSAWNFGAYQVAYAIAGALLLSLPATASTGRRRRLLWLGAAGCAWAATVAHEHYVHFPAAYASLFVALLAGTLLMAFNRLTVPARLRPHLTRLGGAAFGAYLVHVVFLKALSPHLVSAGAGPLRAPAALAALTVVTVVLSFAASLAWDRARLGRVLG
ncbi:acyltransferase [Streptomyces sp. NPDC058691]|uniref:acyltransferase n=1 Tax=Streptomyces sp. NPDC058691 TaxID=3346601 RepID=UPI003653D28E